MPAMLFRSAGARPRAAKALTSLTATGVVLMTGAPARWAIGTAGAYVRPPAGTVDPARLWRRLPLVRAGAS